MTTPYYEHQNTSKQKSQYHTLWIEDGIVFQQYSRELKIMTLEVAKEIIAERIELCNGKTYPIITDSSGASKLEDDARKYLSSKEAQQLLSSFALIVRNPFARLIGNFFIRFEPLSIPAKLFTNKQKAINWSKQFRHLN